MSNKVTSFEHRPTQGQAEFWAKVERCALNNLDLPLEMIQELLSTDWNDNSDVIPFNLGKND